MQIVFDRYEPRGGARHVDLATGGLVDVITWSVPDEDWRRRWRARVNAILEGCAGIEPLIDAGDAGAHAVFEVRAAAAGARAAPRDPRRMPARLAVGWLRARGLSAGPCLAARLTGDGRLCADAQTAWPVETAAEWRAARASWRAWRRLFGGSVPAVPEAARRERPTACADDDYDARAGLVELPVDAGEALVFARASGRVAVDGALDPSGVVPELAGRSCVILRAGRASCAGWSRALAAAGAHRHFYVPVERVALTARERAPAYAPPEPRLRPAPGGQRAQALVLKAARALERGRLAPALRLAGRAALAADGGRLRAGALVIKARALRLGGRAAEAAALLGSELRAADRSAGCALLVEAAEAATDAARLQQGEAFARAALFAASSAPEQAAARSALDRARVWRGEPADTPLWQARAAWH
ncbi:MAG TPA: hypothetical protein VMN81_13840, partial [Vicinamibacterales bacterium]|nr:hypothetical protein [Vicinamibacterales bacterium]